MDKFKARKNVIVVGAGAVGTEIAYLIAQHSLKVIFVEMLDNVMARSLDKDMAEEVEKYIKTKGVERRGKSGLSGDGSG